MASRAVKEAVVDFFAKYLASVKPTNAVIQGFNQRPPAHKMAVVVGRLKNEIEDMLDKWREQGVNGSRSPLPVFFIAFGKDYSSTDLGRGIPVATTDYVVSDDHGNFFKLKADKHDVSVQIVLCAPDSETAFSLASQFKLFCADFGHRHLFSITPYNGLHYGFAMKMEDCNVFGANQQIPEQDNLTVLVFDLSFNCITPYFEGDAERNEPYLTVVQTVVVREQEYHTRRQLYLNVVGRHFEEMA